MLSFVPFFEKEIFKASNSFLFAESKEFLQWIVRWQRSHMYLFRVTFENKNRRIFLPLPQLSYNSSSIWKQNEITYHKFSRRLPMWTRPEWWPLSSESVQIS